MDVKKIQEKKDNLQKEINKLIRSFLNECKLTPYDIKIEQKRIEVDDFEYQKPFDDVKVTVNITL